MNSVVYKYQIDIGPDTATLIKLPSWFTIRHVGIDPGGAVCLWIEHGTPDTNPPIKYCVFVCRATGEVFTPGEPLSDRRQAEYVGTVIQSTYVWHIYKEQS